MRTEPMTEPYLKTENMTVGYQGIPLIKDIELSLVRGEIVTLIGPNGAGKSTILKSICKQLKLLTGQVFLEGMALDRLTEKEMAKKTAIVFTKRISPELMTVWDVVALGRYPYTNRLGILSKEDQIQIEEAMETVWITQLRECEFSNLSDGQKQRVLLARAIAQQPQLLILDEPTSYLDIKYKLEFFSILQKMTREKNIGVLMSLHELDFAQRVSDKILCVHGDRIERFGTPEDIFKDGMISRLYGITQGSFEEKSGLVELNKVTGKSEVFVIAGNQTGSFVFRKLQRQGIPFSVGILSENDLDYPAANALANRVISVKAYEDFTRLDFEKAEAEMLSCEYVICCQKVFGTQNQWNKKLLEKGRETGMNIRFQ